MFYFVFVCWDCFYYDDYLSRKLVVFEYVQYLVDNVMCDSLMGVTRKRFHPETMVRPTNVWCETCLFKPLFGMFGEGGCILYTVQAFEYVCLR